MKILVRNRRKNCHNCNMTSDKLDQIFDLQRALNLRIGVDTENMTDEQRKEWALNYARAMGQELAELVDSVPWKWWAKYQSFDKQNAKVEIVDMLHFLVSLAQVFQMSASDIFEAYTRKHKVNVDRQEAGYTVKDETDNKNV